MEQDHSTAVLQSLLNVDAINSAQLATQFNVDHQVIVGELNKLELEDYIKKEVESTVKLHLTDEGKQYQQTNTPEYQIYQAVPAGGITLDELQKQFNPNIFKVGFANAMSQKYVENKKGTITQSQANANDAVKVLLDLVAAQEPLTKEQLAILKKRKLVVEEITKTFRVTKGVSYKPEFKKKLADLTADLLTNDKWKEQDFKNINLKAQGKYISTGNLHPLLKARKEFSQVLIAMGFEEMATNQYVESSFWNFDALFQPQQHPARDAHDTFFCNDPELCDQGNAELWNKVKDMHENGGNGSIGYKYQWSHEEARKNIFRTHTTAVSSKMLYRIAQEYKVKGYFPKKYFSIDRVFRNETLDATHLAEFHQIEGVVIDKDANLGTLMAIIREFFSKIGIKKLWFKPTYNPYTEPSMEVYGFHPILKKKVEIGNSGIFRPEMLEPLGLPKDVNVMAWGLSLERPTMIYYSVEDIRTMIGHGVEVKTVRSNPFCLFK